MIKTKNIMHSASNRKYTQLSKEGLPLWLYYASRREENTAGCSPATPINPANISNNNLYAGLTSPAMQLDKKVLVITSETLKNIKHRPILDYLYFCKFSFILWGYDKNKSAPNPGRLAISSSVLNSSQAITPSTKITPANPSSSFNFPHASELCEFDLDTERDYQQLCDRDPSLERSNFIVLQEQSWYDLVFELECVQADYKRGTSKALGEQCLVSIPEETNGPPARIAALAQFRLEHLQQLSIDVFSYSGFTITQYDSRIVEYLECHRPERVPIHFSPTVLANTNTLKQILHDEKLRAYLPGSALATMGAAQSEIALEILSSPLMSSKLQTANLSIDHDMRECEDDEDNKPIIELKLEIRKLKLLAPHPVFLNEAWDQIKLTIAELEMLLDNQDNAQHNKQNTIILTAASCFELSVSKELANKIFTHYLEPKLEQIFELKVETTFNAYIAILIWEKINSMSDISKRLNQHVTFTNNLYNSCPKDIGNKIIKVLERPETQLNTQQDSNNNDDITKIELELALKDYQLANTIITDNTRRLSSETVVALAIAHKKIAEFVLVTEHRSLYIDREEWTNILQAHPDLADQIYIGTPLHNLNEVTHLYCETSADLVAKKPEHLSQLQSLFIYSHFDTTINIYDHEPNDLDNPSRTYLNFRKHQVVGGTLQVEKTPREAIISDFKEMMSLVIIKAPRLREITIPDTLGALVFPTNIELYNGYNKVAIKTWKTGKPLELKAYIQAKTHSAPSHRNNYQETNLITREKSTPVTQGLLPGSGAGLGAGAGAGSSADTKTTSQAETGYLYKNIVPIRPRALNAAANNKTNNYMLKPIFEIDPTHQTQEISDQLDKMLDMSWQKIYFYDEENQAHAIEPTQDEISLLKEVKIDSRPVNYAEEITLSFIDFSALEKMKNGGIILPKLTQQQRITHCVGGKTKEDEFGRWIFFPDQADAIDQCELAIALPVNLDPDEVISIKNIKNKNWNDIPEVESIKQCMLGVYQSWQENNISCEQRVREIISLLKNNFKQDLFYGSTDSHAYLVAKCSDGKYRRINLGGSDNYTEEYLPVEKKSASASAHSHKKDNNKAGLIEDNFTEKHAQQSAELDAHIVESDIAITELLQDPKYKKILIQCAEQQTSTVIEFQAHQNHSVYIAHNFSEFETQQNTLKINAHDEAYFDENSLFTDWLEQAKKTPNKNFMLIILLDKLNPHDQVRLNTLWADAGEQTVQGISLPANIQIITQTTQEIARADKSLKRRQNLRFKLTAKHIGQLKSTTQLKNSSEEKSALVVIDINAYPDWKAELFGRIILKDNLPIWEKSLFAENLLSGKLTAEKIILENIGHEQQQEALAFISESKALGYFDYHGCLLPYPKSGEAIISDKKFNFSLFTVEVFQESPEQFIHADIVINTYLFDHLLLGKNINNEKQTYNTTPGIIARYSKQSLTLKISSNLSDSQWYCLFSEARKYQVKLKLIITESVTPPKEAKTIPVMLEQQTSLLAMPLGSLPKVYLTNNADGFYQDQKTRFDSKLVFDIEDYAYGDLFYQERHAFVSNQFKHFHCEQSDVLLALERGENVVLKGQFSEAMLHYLHEIIATGYVKQAGHVTKLKGQMSLIIETPKLTPDNQLAVAREHNLAWLPEHNIEFHYTNPLSAKNIIKLDEPRELIDWDNLSLEDLSAEKAKQFSSHRKSLLLTTLKQHPWAALTGKTGIGKSRLLQLLKQDGYAVHSGLDNLATWAESYPGTEESPSILFLDESNFINKQLTFLSPLASEERPTKILYKNKIFTIGKHQKIVLGNNHESYAGGRVKQSLYTKHTIPHIYLSDFHPAYIYQEVLFPLYEKSSEFIRRQIPKEKFEYYCLALIKSYGLKIGEKQNKEHDSVRYLQEQVLDYLSPFGYLADYQTSTPNNISSFFHTVQTYNTEQPYSQPQKNIHAQLSQKISQFVLKQRKHLPNHGTGLNGLLIEGDPGVGKTTVIRDILEENFAGDYIKLDANMSSKDQKKLITLAFRTGKILWLDEINSLLNTDIEAYLNAALTGEDPETGVYAGDDAPVFLMLATANKNYMQGRSNISPALRARFIQHEIVTKTDHHKSDIVSAPASAAISSTPATLEQRHKEEKNSGSALNSPQKLKSELEADSDSESESEQVLELKLTIAESLASLDTEPGRSDFIHRYNAQRTNSFYMRDFEAKYQNKSVSDVILNYYSQTKPDNSSTTAKTLASYSQAYNNSELVKVFTQLERLRGNTETLDYIASQITLIKLQHGQSHN